MDTGGLGVGLNASAAVARRAGIDTTEPAVTVDRMSLAGAVNRHVPAMIGPTPWEGMTRFSTIGNVTHEFYKPFAVTFGSGQIFMRATPTGLTRELGITLPEAAAPVASYVPAVEVNGLLHISGQVSFAGDGTLIKGRLGEDMDLDAGMAAARRPRRDP